MSSVRTASFVSLLLFVVAVLLHGWFLALHWPCIVSPESSPCFSAGAPFGNCSPAFGALGLGVPLYASLANALLVVPGSFLSVSSLRRQPLVGGIALSTLSFAALVPITFGVEVAFPRAIGASFGVFLLGSSTAALLGLLASLCLRGAARVMGATCLLSALGVFYLVPFAFWLTFD
jgi:hypothetical protein